MIYGKLFLRFCGLLFGLVAFTSIAGEMMITVTNNTGATIYGQFWRVSSSGCGTSISGRAGSVGGGNSVMTLVTNGTTWSEKQGTCATGDYYYFKYDSCVSSSSVGAANSTSTTLIGGCDATSTNCPYSPTKFIKVRVHNASRYYTGIFRVNDNDGNHIMAAAAGASLDILPGGYTETITLSLPAGGSLVANVYRDIVSFDNYTIGTETVGALDSGSGWTDTEGAAPIVTFEYSGSLQGEFNLNATNTLVPYEGLSNFIYYGRNAAMTNLAMEGTLRTAIEQAHIDNLKQVIESRSTASSVAGSINTNLNRVNQNLTNMSIQITNNLTLSNISDNATHSLLESLTNSVEQGRLQNAGYSNQFGQFAGTATNLLHGISTNLAGNSTNVNDARTHELLESMLGRMPSTNYATNDAFLEGSEYGSNMSANLDSMREGFGDFQFDGAPTLSSIDMVLHMPNYMSMFAAPDVRGGPKADALDWDIDCNPANSPMMASFAAGLRNLIIWTCGLLLLLHNYRVFEENVGILFRVQPATSAQANPLLIGSTALIAAGLICIAISALPFFFGVYLSTALNSVVGVNPVEELRDSDSAWYLALALFDFFLPLSAMIGALVSALMFRMTVNAMYMVIASIIKFCVG